MKGLMGTGRVSNTPLQLLANNECDGSLEELASTINTLFQSVGSCLTPLPPNSPHFDSNDVATLQTACE